MLNLRFLGYLFFFVATLAKSQSDKDIIIVEIMKNPANLLDEQGEWFELYNTTNTDISLNGWHITDADIDGFTLESDSALIVPANGFFVLGCTPDPDLGSMASFDYTYDYALFSLSNSSDEIILSRPDSSIVAAIYYNDDDFPDPRGASMVFTGTPAADINIGTNWSNSLLPNESSPNFSLVEKGSPGIRGVQQGLLYTLINGLTEATPTLPLNTFSESFDAPTIDLSLNEQAITAPSIMIK